LHFFGEKILPIEVLQPRVLHYFSCSVEA
jgi:hypothetical protein